MILSSIRTNISGKWPLLFVALLIVPQIAMGQNQKKASTTPPPEAALAVAPKLQPKPDAPGVKQPVQTTSQHAGAKPEHNATGAGSSAEAGDAAESQHRKQDQRITLPPGTGQGN